MSRNLIDMDTLTEMIKRVCCHAEDETDLLDALKETPTIDAVQVVRCKDCKYRYKMSCHEAEFYECSHIGLTSESGKITHVGVTDDFFCADGEVKNDE